MPLDEPRKTGRQGAPFLECGSIISEGTRRCSIFPYHISKRYSAWWSRIQLSRRLTSRPSGFPHALFARAAGSGVLAGGWRSAGAAGAAHGQVRVLVDLRIKEVNNAERIVMPVDAQQHAGIV